MPDITLPPHGQRNWDTTPDGGLNAAIEAINDQVDANTTELEQLTNASLTDVFTAANSYVIVSQLFRVVGGLCFFDLVFTAPAVPSTSQVVATIASGFRPLLGIITAVFYTSSGLPAGRGIIIGTGGNCTTDSGTALVAFTTYSINGTFVHI